MKVTVFLTLAAVCILTAAAGAQDPPNMGDAFAGPGKRTLFIGR